MNTISPMKNTRNNNLSESYTRSLGHARTAKDNNLTRKQQRKNKRLRMALGA